MAFSLKPVDRAGLRNLYPAMRRDFPKAELKPLSKLERQLRQGRCQVWLVLEDETPRGYASVLLTPGCPYVLLDYLAMFPGQRGGGYGSRALALLKEQYPAGILAEAEAELPGDGEESQTRRRRIAFYQKNGFVPCPFENSIFGVEYLVHLWTPQPVEHPGREAAQAMIVHYRGQLPPMVFHACVKIRAE